MSNYVHIRVSQKRWSRSAGVTKMENFSHKSRLPNQRKTLSRESSLDSPDNRRENI